MTVLMNVIQNSLMISMQPQKNFGVVMAQGTITQKCPAWKKWTDNCWVVKQPFDVGIKVDTKEERVNTDLSQDAYDQYFHVGENWLGGEYPEIQFKLNYMSGQTRKMYGWNRYHILYCLDLDLN